MLTIGYVDDVAMLIGNDAKIVMYVMLQKYPIQKKERVSQIRSEFNNTSNVHHFSNQKHQKKKNRIL